MTQKAVEVQDLNEDIDEDGTTAAERASYALAKMQRAAWELARTQQAVTFSGRLPNTPTWEMNDWLMKHPEWHIVQMTAPVTARSAITARPGPIRSSPA